MNLHLYLHLAAYIVSDSLNCPGSPRVSGTNSGMSGVIVNSVRLSSMLWSKSLRRNFKDLAHKYLMQTHPKA